MKNITITAAMNRLICCHAWGMNFQVKPNSLVADSLKDMRVNPFPATIPERAQYIQPEYNPETETRDLKLGVIMIGRGAHSLAIDEENEAYAITYPHRATHTGLFKPLPFIMRKVSDGLSEEDKLLYCLREIAEIDGVLYEVYFGRRFTAIENEIIEVIETVEDGKVIDEITYEPTVNDLYPVPEAMDVDSKGAFMRTYSSIPVGFTPEQAEEVINCCELLYGNRNKAVVSEIAWCFGKDKPVSRIRSEEGDSILTASPGTREFAACHMGIVESTYKPIVFSGGIDDIKNIGISEPLYGGR